jgi:hypothetical protein
LELLVLHEAFDVVSLSCWVFVEEVHEFVVLEADFLELLHQFLLPLRLQEGDLLQFLQV